MIGRRMAFYHEPTQKFYYHLENSTPRILANLASSALFLSVLSLRFFFNRLRYRLGNYGEYKTEGFGLKKHGR